MFRELVIILKTIFFIGENSTFDACVSSQISRTPPEQREHYTPRIGECDIHVRKCEL